LTFRKVLLNKADLGKASVPAGVGNEGKKEIIQGPGREKRYGGRKGEYLPGKKTRDE